MPATHEFLASHRPVLAFGPFQMDTIQRQLFRANQRVRLGSRALEILLTLVEQPGQTVSKRELYARVWPGFVVNDAALRVHVSTLRKALGESSSGVRYVENVSGQGYRFIGKIEPLEITSSLVRSADWRNDSGEPSAPGFGRDEDLQSALAMLRERRQVTIVGAGGIGKTHLANAAAEIATKNADDVKIVNLTSVRDARQLSEAVADALGVPSASTGNSQVSFADLKHQHLLLLLDNCEHVIGAVARLVERLRSEAPEVRILATSREPLRAVGESIFRLMGLQMPESASGVTLTQALNFPAIQLLLKRASESCCYNATDADVPAILAICRRLEGIPLWIELAAMRVGLVGVHGVAAQLDNFLVFLTEGKRTAPLRQQTLRATLDWSFDLLCAAEQRALGSLAALEGRFDLKSAERTISRAAVAARDTTEIVLSLAAKSLIFSEGDFAGSYFRVPEVVRRYALQRCSLIVSAMVSTAQ